jgi:long-chain acyl-CoA synthetase
VRGSRKGLALILLFHFLSSLSIHLLIDIFCPICVAVGRPGVAPLTSLSSSLLPCSTNHCPLSIIFSAANHLPSLLKIAPQCPSLRVIVTMDTLPRAERDVLSQWASSVGVELLDMAEMERWGAEEGVRCAPGPVKGLEGEDELDRDRVVTISYTSGTTGAWIGLIALRMTEGEERYAGCRG